MDKLSLTGARELLARLRGLPEEMQRLHQRIDALEEQVREGRRHQQRLAELTDVVQELLLPIAQRDQDRIDEVLATYVDHLA
jgi:prefoldin subunit 5